VSDDITVSDDSDADSSPSEGKGWRTAEGDRLRDFGVDEDVEFYDYRYGGDANTDGVDEDDEDNIPLAKLLEKRKREKEAAKLK
jgi:palmitoyltransferase